MLAAIVRFSLAHRAVVLAAAAIIAGLGALALSRLDVDVLPDLNRPLITIMTEAGGLATEEVEQQVTRPLERALLGLPSMLRLRSSSSLGLSVVALEFDWATDTTGVRQHVSERVAAAQRELPTGITPRLQPVSSIMGEIMLVALTGDADAIRLRAVADGVVSPRLLAISGVSQVTVIGGAAAQVLIEPNLALMAALDVSAADIERAVARFGLSSGGGTISTRGGSETTIRGTGEEMNPAGLVRLAVATRDGVAVTLGQVAKVGVASRPERGSAGYNGGDAVILSVQKQPGADTRALTPRITAALGELQATMPAGLRVDRVLFRQADFITVALGNVGRALLEASAIVAIVLFLFLGNVRTLLISIVAIPLSLLAAVLAFRWLGVSINTLTLGGLAIAIGELVDDAVVDVENVVRRLRENGAAAAPRPTVLPEHDLIGKPVPAFRDHALVIVAAASAEVRSGILLASVVIMAMVAPLLLLDGVEGQLLRPLATAYIVGIGASLLTAMTVTPVLCSLLLRADMAAEPWPMRGAKGLLVRWLPRAMAHDRAVLAVAAGLVLLAAGALASLPRSLMPAFNEGSLTIQLSALPGITLADSSEIGRIAERLLLEVPEVAAVGRRTGRAEQDEHAQGVETSEIDVALTPGLRRRAEIMSDIRQRLALLPTSVNIGQPVSHRVDHLASGVRAGLVVKLFGEDFEQLDALASRLARELAGIRGLVDVQVETQARVPSVEVRPDGRRAAFYGVAPAAAVDGVTGLAQGRPLSHRWSEDLRTEVVLRLAERDRSNLGHVLVETPDGRVPLRDLADVVEADARNRIEREDGRRRIAVLANLDGGNAGATIDAVRATMAGLGLPPGYRMALEGSHAGQAAAARTVLGAALAVLLLTLLILIARYRALPLALIVLSSIPLALVGGVAALVLAGLPLSLASVVGFVTLAGIALRNSILKVSHALNLHRVDGMPFGDQLVLRASRERLAPVLMTALAAAGGLLPLALGADAAGKEILYPVAVVVIGGLLSCTLLDSFVVPLLLRRFGVRSFARSRMRHAQASF